MKIKPTHVLSQPSAHYELEWDSRTERVRLKGTGDDDWAGPYTEKILKMLGWKFKRITPLYLENK